MLRRLRYFTRRGHTDGVTCVCAGAYFHQNTVVTTVDELVVTGSKDGNVVVWEIDKSIDVFRLKCLFCSESSRYQLDARDRINDVICYIVSPCQPGSLLYEDAFVVAACAVDGVKVWHFRSTPDPSLGAHSEIPMRFVDRLNEVGLPECWHADSKCSHLCRDCGHDAQVLCLALAPPRSTELAAQERFCFSFFTGAADGRGRLWDVFRQAAGSGENDRHLRLEEADARNPAERGSQDDRRMMEEHSDGTQLKHSYGVPNKYRLRHSRGSEVNCICLSAYGNDNMVVLSGDSLGIVKMWKYGEDPVLLRTFTHNGNASVQSVALTPVLAWHSKQYIVASVGGTTCFVWPAPDKFTTVVEHLDEEDHVNDYHFRYFFRASSLAFYDNVSHESTRNKHRDPSSAFGPFRNAWSAPGDDASADRNGLFAITSAPDGMARMWHLLGDNGRFTTPIWQKDNPDLEGIGNTQCEIVAQFYHTDKVNAVAMVTATKRRYQDHLLVEPMVNGNERAQLHFCVGDGKETQASKTMVEPVPLGIVESLPQAAEDFSCGNPPSSLQELPRGASRRDFLEERHMAGATPSSISESMAPMTCKPVLLTASDDCSCMMWDARSGHPIRALRAATVSEMFAPLLLMCLSTCQLVSFAFDTDLKISRGTQPDNILSQVASFGVADLLNIQELSDKDARVICLITIITACVFSTVFIALSVGEAVTRFHRQVTHVENQPSFRLEVRDMRTGLGQLPMGPMHKRYYRILLVRNLSWVFLYFGSAVCLVPMAKAASTVIDCQEIDAKQASSSGGSIVVTYERSVACWDPSWHLPRVILVSGLVCVYFFIAQAFCVVKGQAHLVERGDLWNLVRWYRNCQQAARLVFLGPMQTHPFNFFLATIAENITKAICPILARAFIRLKVLRLICMLALHAGVLICFSIFPLFVTASMSCIASGLKFITMYAYICSLVAECLDKDDAIYVAHAWHASLVLLIVIISCLYQSFARREEEQERLRNESVLTIAACIREQERSEFLLKSNAKSKRTFKESRSWAKSKSTSSSPDSG